MTDVIIIEDKWKVSVDKYNHQIHQWHVGGREILSGENKGKHTQPEWKALSSYHINMAAAIKEIIKLETCTATECALERWLELQLEVTQHIYETIEGVVA